MYTYIYVKSKASSVFRISDHRELIDKYSREGWRFVSAIPSDFELNGKINEFDLVFEKKVKQYCFYKFNKQKEYLKFKILFLY